MRAVASGLIARRNQDVASALDARHQLLYTRTAAKMVRTDEQTTAATVYTHQAAQVSTAVEVGSSTLLDIRA